jgi:hypothetical protein
MMLIVVVRKKVVIVQEWLVTKIPVLPPAPVLYYSPLGHGTTGAKHCPWRDHQRRRELTEKERLNILLHKARGESNRRIEREIGLSKSSFSW